MLPQNPSSLHHDRTFVGSIVGKKCSVDGMKAMLRALIGLTFLWSMPVHAWDEDPRCQRRRALKRALTANNEISNIPVLDLITSNENGMDDATMNHNLLQAGTNLEGDLMGIPNNSSGIPYTHESETNEVNLKEAESPLFQPYNASVSLRGKTDVTSHRRLEDFNFQIKMHWEEGFCWQEEWRERKWCWQCEGGNCKLIGIVRWRRSPWKASF